MTIDQDVRKHIDNYGKMFADCEDSYQRLTIEIQSLTYINLFTDKDIASEAYDLYNYYKRFYLENETKEDDGKWIGCL